MNNNNNSYNQFPFAPYEVQHQPLQSGLGAVPQMPGYTPVLMNVPAFPQENGFVPPQIQPQFPLQMQPFPLFLQPNPQFPLQNSASPVFLPMISPLNNVPSMSPPMFSSLSPNPMVSVSSPPMMTPSQPPQTHTNSQFLGSGLRDVSRSRSASVQSDHSLASDSGEIERSRHRSVSRESGGFEAPSKRALVDSTLGWMESVFGDKYDNDGTRGENVLRLKVKTVIALENIVEFISRCNQEGLIESISCPVSTKKGRQHVRGYLAYIKGFSGNSADRIEAIFEAFNQEKGYPFKTLHRNPASTL